MGLGNLTSSRYQELRVEDLTCLYPGLLCLNHMYTMYLVEESLANFCFDVSLLVCASNHLCYLARWFFIDYPLIFMYPLV